MAKRTSTQLMRSPNKSALLCRLSLSFVDIEPLTELRTWAGPFRSKLELVESSIFCPRKTRQWSSFDLPYIIIYILLVYQRGMSIAQRKVRIGSSRHTLQHSVTHACGDSILFYVLFFLKVGMQLHHRNFQSYRMRDSKISREKLSCKLVLLFPHLIFADTKGPFSIAWFHYTISKKVVHYDFVLNNELSIFEILSAEVSTFSA